MKDFEVKITTFKEAKKKLFGGLNKIKYNVKQFNICYEPARKHIGYIYLVYKIYNRLKKCTYATLTVYGRLTGHGPSKDAKTFVIRFPGEIDDDEILNNVLFNAFYEHLYLDYETK